MNFMKYKHIEAMREVRLWIGQIIVPVAALVFAISPEARTSVAEKMRDVKVKISEKLKRA